MGIHFKDLTNHKFGRLTTLYRLHNIKGDTKWLCVCECGNLKEAYINNLTRGKTKSCGCYNKEVITKHGKCNTRLYHIYNTMKSRCYNKNNKDYPNYGGRGIVVCDEWLDDFETFYNWAIDNNYRDDLTIDRIDVNGNYEPVNCRWLTLKQQARNTRTNRNITVNNETHCLSEWCEIQNLDYSKVQKRIDELGWPIEKALELK